MTDKAWKAQERWTEQSRHSRCILATVERPTPYSRRFHTGCSMYVKYALVADHVVPAGVGQKWNVLGTFTNITAEEFPYTHQRLGLLVRVEGHSTEAGEAGKHTLEIYLIDEDGQRLRAPRPLKAEFKFDASPGIPPGLEIGMELNGVVFEKPGNYEFAIKVDGTYLDSAPLYVRKAGRG